MRRSRTPTTAWPAVADLMTILAVVGLTAAAVVAGVGRSQDSESDVLTELQLLQGSLRQRDSTVSTLQDSITKLIRRQKVGFDPCWPGPAGGKRYFRTYDVTHGDEGYFVVLNSEFEQGIGSAPPLSSDATAVMREVPVDFVSESDLAAFGQRVTGAVQGYYASGCKLVATIDTLFTKSEYDVVGGAGFYPVWR